MKRINESDAPTDIKKIKSEDNQQIANNSNKKITKLTGWSDFPRPLPVLTPKWIAAKNTTIPQNISDDYIHLDNAGNNYISIQTNILTPDQKQQFLKKEAELDRYQVAFMGRPIPRYECIFGDEFNYSGVKRPYLKNVPEHIQNLIDICKSVADKRILEITGQPNKFNKQSNGIDILYSKDFANGGSLGMHKDNESMKISKKDHWGCIMIYSVGQTRWLRIKRDSDGHYYNVPTIDNSLILMYGDTFQYPAPDGYTHGIEKLSADDVVGSRVTVNIRFQAFNDE